MNDPRVFALYVCLLFVQRVEERRTVFDDEGEQTTVTRTVDGQTVRQTTIQKKTGDTETVEDLINMDESKYGTISVDSRTVTEAVVIMRLRCTKYCNS